VDPIRKALALGFFRRDRAAAKDEVLALVTEPKSIARYLRGIGEPTEVPKRTPARGPTYDPWKSPTGEWASRVLRRGGGSVEAAE
jgi:hypothetical protein